MSDPNPSGALSNLLRTSDPRTLLRARRKQQEVKPPLIVFVPKVFPKEDAYGNIRIYELSFIQRVFVTFDDASASELGKTLNLILLLAVLVATVFLVMSTIPSLKVTVHSCEEPACENDSFLCPNTVVCEPEAPATFEMVQSACAYIFCLDYFTRVFLVGFVPEINDIS